LVIAVQDNGENLSDEELNRLDQALKGADESPESTGVLNIHRRLQLRFGAAYGIAVSRSALGGLRVEIILPIGEE
jgi:two-component system sensor histidine kinase YesM